MIAGYFYAAQSGPQPKAGSNGASIDLYQEATVAEAYTQPGEIPQTRLEITDVQQYSHPRRGR